MLPSGTADIRLRDRHRLYPIARHSREITESKVCSCATRIEVSAARASASASRGFPASYSTEKATHAQAAREGLLQRCSCKRSRCHPTRDSASRRLRPDKHQHDRRVAATARPESQTNHAPPAIRCDCDCQTTPIDARRGISPGADTRARIVAAPQARAPASR